MAWGRRSGRPLASTTWTGGQWPCGCAFAEPLSAGLSLRGRLLRALPLPLVLRRRFLRVVGASTIRHDCAPCVRKLRELPNLGSSCFGKFYSGGYAVATPWAAKKTLMTKSRHSKKYSHFLVAFRQARKDAGLTQEQVAKRLNVYATFVCKCESGERRLDVVELAEFCRIYGISLSELARRAGLE